MVKSRKCWYFRTGVSFLLKSDKQIGCKFAIILMIAQVQDDNQLGMAVAISKAIVGEDQSCSLTVFLQKFYKRNLSQKNKISEVRSSRFNTLLYKVYEKFQEMTADDLDVLFLSIFCFISKVTNYSHDEDRLRTLSATCYWIGKLMTVSAGHSPQIASRVVELLEYMLRAKKLNILKLEEYKEQLMKCEALKKIELFSEEETYANSVKSDVVVIEDEDHALSVLRSTDLSRMFSNLLMNEQKIVVLVELLLASVEKIPVGPRFDFFYKTMCSNPPTNKEDYLEGLECAFNKAEFDARGKASLRQIINQVKLDKPICTQKQGAIGITEMGIMLTKKVKPEVLREQILNRGTEGSIEDAIQLFEKSLEPSYIPLYLIIQHNQPIPKSKLKELYELNEIKNRQGIIIALMITQQRKTIINQLLRLYSQIKDPSRQTRINTVLLLHFALQPQPNQSQLLTKIMQDIACKMLNDRCTFQFLPLQPLQKYKFDKPEKTLIMQLLSPDIDTTERMYRVKIDMYAALGESVPLLASIENAVKFTSKKVDEMLEALMTVTDDTLLEILLIKLNTVADKYTGEFNPKLVDWAVKTHIKQQEKYKKVVKDYFASIGIENHMNFALAIKAWNKASKDNLSVPPLEPFLRENNTMKISEDNYASFLIHVKNMNSLHDQTIRAESRLQQLEIFISLLDEKIAAKKELKKITEHYSCPQIFLLQALRYYAAFDLNYPALLSKIINSLSSDAEQQEQIEKKADELEIEFESVEFFFDFMLINAYEDSISYICKLMKSKSPKDEKLVKRKKGRKRDRDEAKDLPARVIQAFLESLPLALKGSEKLGNLNELIQIIERIIKLKTADESIAPNLIQWISTFGNFKFKDFEDLTQKVSSLRSFWNAAEKVLTDKMSISDIENQVGLVTQLLAKVKQFNLEGKYEELEYDLLTILQILCSLQHSHHMEAEAVSKAPRHRLHSFPEKYRLRHNSDILYFYCEICSRNVCEACANFMHRNHDKNFVTKDKGSCSHEADQKSGPSNPRNERLRYDPEDLEEIQKMEMLSKLDLEKLVQMKRVMQEKGVRDTFRDRERIRELERDIHREEIVNIYEAKKTAQPAANDDLMDIKSGTEKSIIENMSLPCLDFLEPKFVELPPEGSQGPSNKVSMPLLMSELMQSIQQYSGKRWGDNESQYGSSFCIEKFNFDSSALQVIMEPIMDRYNMLTVNAVQGNRILVASNGKFTVVLTSVPGSNVINFYNEQRLRKCFKKRERSKKYNGPEGDGSFAVEKGLNVNFEVISLLFCKKSPNLLLICGHTQFQIFNLTTDRKIPYHLNLGSEKLTKVVWLPDSSTRIVALTLKQIRIYELSYDQNPIPRFLAKITSPKVIKDFAIFKNQESSVYNIYICDIEGGLFYEKLLPEDEKVLIVSNQINMSDYEHPDNISSFVVTAKADLGILAFKEGSNLVCRLNQGKIVKSMDMKLQALVSPRSDYSNTLERVGHVITNVKELYISKEASIFACLLKKPRLGPNAPGNFAIIEISGTNNMNIQFTNGNFKTETFQILSYDDEGDSDKFLILIVETDGSVWLKPYEIRRGLIQQPKFESLSEDRIEEYNKAILDKNFLNFIGPGGSRCLEFKEYMKLSPPNMNDLGEKLQLTFNQFAFVTGIIFRIDAACQVRIQMFDKVYEFNAKQPREIQIPLTLKQTLQTFLTRTLTITCKKRFPIDIYGLPWDKPSVYSEAYRELVRLYTNYYSFNTKDAGNYFNNPGRSDLMNLPQQTMTKLFKDANIDQCQINFILKVELLIQAFDRNGMSLSIPQIEEFLNKIKKFLYVDRLYVKTSLKRLFRKIFWLYRIVSQGQGRSISLGDPYDYFTFKDIFWVQKKYKDFLNRNNLQTLDRLLSKLNKLKYKRLANLYLMFGLFPNMLLRVFEFYKRELQSSSQSHKQRMNDRITIIIRILSEYYQYNKNRGSTESELETFYLMELLLSGLTKTNEIYKEVILRSFYCFESLPIVENVIEFSYGCRLFQISSGTIARPAINFSNIDDDVSVPVEEFKAEESDEDEMRAEEDGSSILREDSSLMIVEPIKHSSVIETEIKEINSSKALTEQRQHCHLQVTYYDFIYELIVSLFTIESRVKRENSCYYIGLLSNLLCLFDVRINVYSEGLKKRLIKSLVNAIDNRLLTGASPSLFIALAHFMEPNYDELRKNGRPVDVAAESRKLKSHILRYYAETGTSLEPLKALPLQKAPKPGSRSMILSEAFFHEIDVDTHIYQIKYLGNLYLNMYLQNIPRLTPTTKQCILKGFVKDKIRVFKNIVILQDWVSELETMKLTAAFDQLKQGQYESGFNRILTTSKKQPSILLTFMNAEPSRLQFLESLLDNPVVQQHANLLMQVISLYYSTL